MGNSYIGPMSFNARFKGFNTGNTFPLDQVVYRDSDGGLLEVEHDMAQLRTRSAQEWKTLFESRCGSHNWPYASGVWGKKEWVLPGIAEEDIISLFKPCMNHRLQLNFQAEAEGVGVGAILDTVLKSA